MHPIIEEIARVKGGEAVREDVFRRWQRGLQVEVQPLLDERDRLIEENADLREQLPKRGKAVA